MKIRTFIDSNYRAIFINNKVIRIAIYPTKPITELKYPEFYDIKITDVCDGGCRYCYQDSKINSEHFKDICINIDKFFGIMNKNELPFSIAIGGGEPTLHPEFCNFIELVKTKYDILPNITTNGKFIYDSNCEIILKYIKDYCGAVAITCHRHIYPDINKVIDIMLNNGMYINLQFIMIDNSDVDFLYDVYNKYKNTDIKYFTILPFVSKGRGYNIDSNINYEYLLDMITNNNMYRFSFGARMLSIFKIFKDKYEWINKVSMSDVEKCTRYLDMSNMKQYDNSFNMMEVVNEK